MKEFLFLRDEGSNNIKSRKNDVYLRVGDWAARPNASAPHGERGAGSSPSPPTRCNQYNESRKFKVLK